MDVGRLVNYVSDEIKKRRQDKPPAMPTIFKAPKIVRSSDPGAYEPKLVSIGPYHRAKSKDDLKPMEDLKWRLLDNYFSKASRNGETLEECTDRFLRAMEGFEQDARNCYSEVINIKSDEFVKMLLLDGCFLVQIFSYGTWKEEERPKELTSLLINNLSIPGLLFRDLLLLENQIPYFVVTHLRNELGIVHTTVPYFEIFSQFLPGKLSLPNVLEDPEVHHLLHLLHKCILHNLKESRGASDPQQQGRRESIPDTKITMDGSDWLKSQLDKGLLEIPAIVVNDDTNFILRNLIAFEQCYQKLYRESYNTSSSAHELLNMQVTNYTLFMDDIINTPRDVDLLCEKGIILRNLGSDTEIATLFNELGKGVFYTEEGNHLVQVYKEVKDYCESPWHKHRARLMRDYFSSPWTIISVVAAAALFALTIVQTVYSALSYQRE